MRRTNTELLRVVQQEHREMKKAIKAHCLECLCEQKVDCMMPACPMYPYRPYKISK